MATKQERLNFRANIDGDITRKFKVRASISVTSTQNREVQEGWFNQGSILGALIYLLIFWAYDDNGNLSKNEAASQQPMFGYQTVKNPVALAMETNITRHGLRQLQRHGDLRDYSRSRSKGQLGNADLQREVRILFANEFE